MNKTELVDHVAQTADITKAAAGRALDAMIGAIVNALGNGDTVTLIGFGTFVVRHRKAREGRNPQTGSTIKIAESKLPAFRPGKALKDAINHGRNQDKQDENKL